MKYILLALTVLALALAVFAKIEHGRADTATKAATAAQEHAKNAEQALTKANEQAALQRASSLARQQELNRLRKQSEATTKALNDALQANRDWAATAVPDGVWDALTAPAGTAGQAGPGVDRGSPGAAAAGPR